MKALIVHAQLSASVKEETVRMNQSTVKVPSRFQTCTWRVGWDGRVRVV